MVNLASLLQDQNMLDEAFGFVMYYSEWKEYLQRQSMISFKKIYDTDSIFCDMGRKEYDEDEILRIEREYGQEHIWKMLSEFSAHAEYDYHFYMGHPRYTKMEKRLFIQLCFEKAEQIIENTKVNCIIDFAGGSLIRDAFDAVAKKRGIPYMYQLGCRWSDRMIIECRARPQYSILKDKYNDILGNAKSIRDGQSELEKFRLTTSTSYKKFNRFDRIESQPTKNVASRLFNRSKAKLVVYFGYLKRLLHLLRTEGLKTFHRIPFIEELSIRFKSRTQPYYKYNWMLYKNLYTISVIRKWKMKTNLKRVLKKKIFVKENSLSKKYLLITLHYQPEGSTSVDAPFFVNQSAFVRNVALALPLDYELVVKPHPTMLSIDHPSVYELMDKIPNVTLIHPSCPIRSLIENAKGVVAIAGTSGFEGLLLGKPVIVFGTPIYAVCDSVIRCTDYTKLYDIIKDFDSYKSDDYHIAAYLQAVIESSFPLDTNNIWLNQEQNLEDEDYRKNLSDIANHLVNTFLSYHSKLKYQEGNVFSANDMHAKEERLICD